MSQTSYDLAPARGFAGARADNGPADFLSRVNGDAVAIPFGSAVCFDTNDQECDLPAAVTDKVVGICVHSMAYQPGMSTDGSLGATGVNTDCQVSVIRKGRIYLTSEENVVPGDRLFARAVAGAGGTVLGAWRKSHVAGETIDTSNQVVVLSTALAGAVFVAEVDFTAQSTREQVAKLVAAVTAADGTGTAATLKSTLLTQLGLLV